jgi:hypothetical protein
MRESFRITFAFVYERARVASIGAGIFDAVVAQGSCGELKL